MTLQLDPTFPLVWRTPTSLQLGVDEPLVTLNNVTVAEERILAVLARGTTRQGLRVVGRSCGLTDSQVAKFVSTMAPALYTPTTTDRPLVVVSGTGATVDSVARRLVEAGLAPQLVGPVPDDAVATPELLAAPLAIVVAHYVVDPQLFGLWLRHDVPHLPIVFGDASVRVGPLIEPGTGPCLYCVERTRADADPAWQAIACQLLGRQSKAETPFIASEIAVMAARLARNRLRNGPASTATSFAVSIGSGEVTTRAWQPHPECACQDLTVRAITSAKVRPKTATATAKRSSGRSNSGRLTGTRRGEAASVRA